MTRSATRLVETVAARADQDEAREFLFEEARLLDDQEFSAWLPLFERQCLYWIPCGSAQQNPLESPSFVYDNLSRLTERVDRLRNGLSFCQSPPSRTHHLIGNVQARTLTPEATGGTETTFPVTYLPQDIDLHGGGPVLLVRSKQQVTDLRPGGIQASYLATVTHLLRTGEKPWRILAKKVDLLLANEPVLTLTFLL